MTADPLILGLGIGIPTVLGISYYVYKNTKKDDDNVDKGEWYGSQFNDPKNPIGIHGGSRKRRHNKQKGTKRRSHTKSK